MVPKHGGICVAARADTLNENPTPLSPFWCDFEADDPSWALLFNSRKGAYIVSLTPRLKSPPQLNSFRGGSVAGALTTPRENFSSC